MAPIRQLVLQMRHAAAIVIATTTGKDAQAADKTEHCAKGTDIAAEKPPLHRFKNQNAKQHK